jgi:predicted Na+-dependent transporter
LAIIGLKVSFWISKAFCLNALQSLAILVYGCSPGNLESNTWATGFDGDFEFSTMLTLVTTLSSLGKIEIYYYRIVVNG